MLDITLLPSAKVPLIYPDTNGMTTEWYRFFWNVYGFTGDATGAVPVNKGGTGLTSIGDRQFLMGNVTNTFDKVAFAGAGINITYSSGLVTWSIGASGVTPGTYGSSSKVGQFTINQYGVITFAQDVSIAIDASQIISGTIASARISGSYTGITGVGALTVGTWNADTISTGYGGTGLTTFTSGGALYATSTSTLTSGTLPVTAGGTGQTSFTNGQLLIGNTTGNTLTKATLTAGSGVTITNGTGSITISATGSGGTVTAVTGTAPIVSSGGTTPAISMAAATSSVNGYLTSTDWTTFNSKQPAGTYVTSISIASSNGFTGTSSGGATPSLTLATSITGILKGNGTAISAATSGTDYAPATSGTSILYGNGAGGFSNVTIGTGLTFIGGTLASTASGGTVTSVAATVPAFLSISGSPITTSGTLAITLSGTALPVANGGTGLTSLTAGYIPYGNGTSAFNSSANLYFDGANLLAGATSTALNARLLVKGPSVTATDACATFQNSNGSELFSVYEAGAIRAQYIGSAVGTALVLDASGYIQKLSSSIRYKKDVEPIDIGLDFILGLNPVKYNLKESNEAQVGFIAEDFPDSRLTSMSKIDIEDESKGYQVESVNYAQIVAPLVKALQELKQQFDAYVASHP